MIVTVSPTRHALKWGLRIALLMVLTFFSLLILAYLLQSQMIIAENSFIQIIIMVAGLYRALQQRRKQVDTFRFQEIWSLGTMLSGIIAVLVGLGVMLGMIAYIFILSPTEFNSPSQLFIQIVVSLALVGIVTSLILGFFLKK